MNARIVPVLSKLWGTNRCIFADVNLEVHHAHILKGGYSSRHHHKIKANDFYVLEGSLRVLVYNNDGSVASTVVLDAGMQFAIPAGVEHRFEAITDVELIETYWTSLDPSDIVRADEGGLKPNTDDL